jgi:hypothetical protein
MSSLCTTIANPLASTEHVQKIKCGTELNTIIVQYNIVPNKNKKIKFVFIALSHNRGMVLNYYF